MLIKNLYSSKTIYEGIYRYFTSIKYNIYGNLTYLKLNYFNLRLITVIYHNLR